MYGDDLIKVMATCGYSVGQVAGEFGYDTEDFHGWLMGNMPMPPEAEPWSDRVLLEHHRAVAEVVAEIWHRILHVGMPTYVSLVLWGNQREYDFYGPGNGYYTVANARAKAIARTLEDMDVAVRFTH